MDESPTPSTPPYTRSSPPHSKPRRSPISPSPLHLATNHTRRSPISLHELLILSPSPHRRPPRESLDAPTPTPRRRGKGRAAVAAAAAAAANGLIGCASPRNARRARRRLEKDIARDERELGHGGEDELGRVRRRKQSRTKVAIKEKLDLAASAPSPIPSPLPKVISHDKQIKVEGLWERILELIMWKNVAKSSLWFGFGSMFFLSSSFSKDFSFSIISAICHLGILILGLAFFRDSVPQRQQIKWGGSFELKEEDIVRAARVILPIANAAMSKIREMFSGEPSMTLKVLPLLLFGAKYGHLITFWRLLAAGFFLSFTIPKLYTCYTEQIHRRVENASNWVMEAWKSCPRKRFVAASAATMLWNLFSVKTRIIAAFVSVVILRYHHQRQSIRKEEENGDTEMEEEEQKQAMVLVE
ncbi:reticulon-like protein B18 [Ananas comosus]|uniref:Reticulon-like protein n=1 Tax=Ananas comosus TaxID=4615 RepID=A0A199UJB4_ANACO|nr:reticulon-like protein B18 [Ananas comosus]OAY64829.1 Reticulon-like protein B18 [Ananas comosus]